MKSKTRVRKGMIFSGLLILVLLFVLFRPEAQIMLDQTMNEFQRSIKIDSIYEKENNGSDLVVAKGDVKILNWNIERGYDADQLIQYMHAENPDIICLQEVDWNCKRTGSKDIGALISKSLNMVGYFSTEYIEIDHELRSGKLAGGGLHGNMILTKIRPEKVYRIELPQYFNWTDPPKGTPKRIIGEKRIGGRFGLCAEFMFNDKLTTICSVHFENRDSGGIGRKASLDSLLQQINSAGPLLIAGDLNTFDAWPTRLFGISDRSKGLTECNGANECHCWQNKVLPERNLHPSFNYNEWTFKYAFYKGKLDWMIRRDLEISSKGMGDFNSSDHKPLWITIKAAQ